MSTILGNLKSLFLSLRNRRSQDSVEGNSATSMNEQFRFRYALFKDLLNANTELLNILADIDYIRDKELGNHCRYIGKENQVR